MLGSLRRITVFQIPAGADDLVERYVKAGIFTRTQEADALHVAAAVLTRQDVLLSWNFRHLVNRSRRLLVNALNVSLGLPSVDIISPPEV